MPIYEYYCRPCHTIYSFFARRLADPKPPVCPRCGATPLDKQVSRFAISRGLSEPGSAESDPFANIDESKMDSLMAEMASTFGDEGEGGTDNPSRWLR